MSATKDRNLIISQLTAFSKQPVGRRILIKSNKIEMPTFNSVKISQSQQNAAETLALQSLLSKIQRLLQNLLKTLQYIRHP